MDTKRRHFERHKAGTFHDEDSDGVEARTNIRPISSQRDACQLAASNRLAPSQSLVTSKIGLFERLSNGNVEPRARLSRQAELDEELRMEAGDEVELGDDDVCDDEEEEEFLVLDTIVEEDEETAACESIQVLTSTTTSSANDKLDCDRLSKLTANINNNVPATAERGNFAANSLMTTADENNGLASDSKLAPSTIPPGGGVTQQPPAETRPTQSQSSPLPPPSSSSPSSSSPSSSPLGSEPSNHKAQLLSEHNGEHDKQVRVDELANGDRDEPEDSVEWNSIRLVTETTNTITSATMTTNGENCGAKKEHVSEVEAQMEKHQETAKSTKTKTANNKMQYQTLLPSTNRLISEHQARQQQALFKALNERQKILDELGAGEQLERPDLMSTSSISLNFRSKRHWRKSANRSAASDPRRRSNSASQDQADSSRRRRTNRNDGGVPLSSVDLSSMTDQQVDEILGQIAPASSSSSLVSSRASLMDEFSSSSSSAGSSSEDDFSSSTYSTDNDDDEHELNQDQLKCQMVRRIRRRLAVDSEQPADSEQDFSESTGGRQQQGLAPSVIGVHEDDTISVNSARRSLRSSARNCREAFKKRDKNGPSDDENDHEGDQQGDLFVSVTAASSRGDQQSGGLGHGQVGSNQCSLSPLASQSQTTAAGGGDNLLLASAVRNYAAASHNSLSSSSMVLSQSQSPTTSDEHSSLVNHHGHRSTAQSVEATLSRMLKALDEVGQNHNQNEEQNELAELLERGFVHLEQLLECSQTATMSNNQTLPRSQQQQQLQQQTPSQKDSDYGSDTQSNGDCLSSSVSQSTSGAAGTQTSSSSLSPLAIELSLRLAELLRRLAQQQQITRRQTQLEASTSATPELDVAQSDESCQQQQQQPQPTITKAAPRARMMSVVMINSGGSPSSGNVTPCEPTSRPESQQSQRQFKTRVNIRATTTSPNSCEPTQTSTPNACSGETQIIKVVASGPNQSQGERVSRRTSFLGSSLRRRPSFSGSIASVHREPGLPRPGSPVPRSVLEMQAARAAKSSSESNQMQATAIEQQPEQQQQQQQQQHRVQRALILAQKYNYSPAKLATSKLSAKLNLKELIATGNNYADGNQLGGSSSANRSEGDLDLVGGKTRPPNKISVQAKHIRDGDPTSGTAFDVTGQVQLDISYFARTGSLTVHLLQCSSLTPVNKRRATSNPYVKLYLLPDRSRSGKRKSSVKRHQLNPKFGERFTFGPLQLREFESRTLWLSVWHKDRGLGRNVSLGELHLPLSQIRKQLLTSDLCQSTSSCWYQLKIRERQSNEQALIRQADGTPLTTKKLPLTKETSDTIKRLSDFERRAARLAQQHNHQFTEANKSENQQQPPVNRPKANSAAETTGRLVTGLQLNMDGPGQSPLKTMQVGLGPVQSNGSTIGAECASISGQLFVALKFVPESAEALAKRTSAQVSGSLHVLIKEARDIGGFKKGAAPSSDQLPSPFCKCILLDCNGQKVAKQKTQQLRRTNSPSWNQTLIFPKLKMAALQAQGVEIQLFNRDSILVSSSEHMGSIRLCKRIKDATELALSLNQRCDVDHAINVTSISSSDSLKSSISSTSTNTLNTVDDDLCSEREARLWSQMLARPNIWVYGELPLRQLRPLVDLTTVISKQQTFGSIDNK